MEFIYKEFVIKVKKEKNLVIVKMDVIVNDVFEVFKVEGFFTIYFAVFDNKENFVKYSGGRTVDDFMKYLKEYVIVVFKGKDEL